MNKAYWEDRWKKQGTATVGHFGDSNEAFERQTEMYGEAVRSGLLNARTGSYASVLDFGCGWGRMHPYIAPLTHEYVGFDISHGAVALAREHIPETQFRPWHNTVATDLAETFEAIVCCTVLQHIVDLDELVETVRAIKKMLRPGGRVVLLENSSKLRDKPHIHYRSPGTYQTLFGDGFSWEVLGTVTHNGEDHALLVGDLQP